MNTVPHLLRLLVLLGLAGAAAQAQETVRWNFANARGSLTELTPAWTNDLDSTAVSGRALRIRRAQSTTTNAFYEIPEEMQRRPVWLLVSVSSWNLTGTSNEIVRLGLSANADEKSPSIVAQLKFERQAGGLMFSGESFPNSLPASSLAAVSVGKPDVGGRVQALLHIDPTNRTYRVSYKTAYSKGWQVLGEGTISRTRNPRYLRLGVAGPFNTNRAEHFDLAEIVLSTSDPSTP